MGRYKVIIRLLVACCICGVFLSTENFKHPSRNQLRRDRLLPFQLKDVNEVTLTLANGNEIVLEASPSGWYMTSPSRSRALDSAVQRLLDAFEQAPLLETIDSEEKELRNLTTADFGLNNPVGRMSICGPRFSVHFSIGDCDAVSNSLFVARNMNQVNEHDQAVYVTTSLLREFFLKTPSDYMDRRVFQGDMRLVHTVILRRPALGDVKLVRDERNRHLWNIVQPVSARADREVLGHFFDILADATFVDSYPDTTRQPASGLGEGEAPSVTLFSKNDLAGQTLVLGDHVPGNADLTYARGQTGVMTVTGAVRRLVLIPSYEFRDKRLFPSARIPEVQSLSIDTEGRSLSLRRADDGWAITAPVSDAADSDAAASLMQGIISLRANGFAPFTQQTADARIATVALTLGRSRTPFSFVVYALQSDDDDRVGVLPEGVDVLYITPAQTFSNVLACCSDPRPLLSRTVLALNEEHVRAVTISGPGATTQRLEKVIGEWNSATPGHQINGTAVRRFFTAVASIRADRIASLAPTPLFPLDGGVEIAFDMDDGVSLRRILTIGPRLEDGYPAAVKGNDTIFILSPETVSNLTRPLFVPEEPAPTETPSNPPVTDKDQK